MPFPCHEYRKDFVRADPAPGWDCGDDPLPAPPGDGGTGADAFDRLLAQAASKLELDGGRDDPANDRYDEARSYRGGRSPRRAQLRPADRDLGRQARQRPRRHRRHGALRGQLRPAGVVDSRRQRPAARLGGHRIRPQDAAAGRCRRHVAARPPDPAHRAAPHQPAASAFGIRAVRQPAPPNAARTVRRMARRNAVARDWPWTAYDRLLHFASGLAPPWTPPKPPDHPTARHWFDLYRPADERAGEYAARYRSVYVWVFALASLSLVFAAAALAAGHEAWLKFVMTALECVSLGMIVAFVVANLWRDWHPRWIDYRLLAELCRKQQALAPVGWSLPTWQCRNSPNSPRQTARTTALCRMRRRIARPGLPGNSRP